jgi:undecaprenyl-diphosphatase
MFFLLQSNFWQRLEKLDQWLFIQINSNSVNPFFDALMPFMRYPLNWAPLYLFLGAFVLLNYKGKGAWWILFFVVTIALTDMAGNYIFKQNVPRVRPCGDPDFFSQVRLLVNRCNPGNSFISNHAANHFGIATFFFLTSKPLLKYWACLGFVWAALIAYAQVYVGIHYPFDVIAGAVLGVLFGMLTGSVFNKRHGFANFESQSTGST